MTHFLRRHLTTAVAPESELLGDLASSRIPVGPWASGLQLALAARTWLVLGALPGLAPGDLSFILDETSAALSETRLSVRVQPGTENRF